MKRIVKTIACIALVVFSAACQKELVTPVDEAQENQGPIVITASRPATKVAYDENGTSHSLEGSWEVNDVIFGFTASGTTVSFNVTSVAPGTGVATLTQTTSVDLTEGTMVHAIYCPGKTASDLSEQTLAVDFSSQSESVIPVLLLATATVTSNTLAFTFENAVSIIGIKNPVFQGTTTATKVLNITVSGHEIVSSGVVSVSGGSLVFTGNAPDKFITKAVNAAPVLGGESFTLADPAYIVVPAGPIAIISAIDNKNNFFTYSVNQTAVTSKYYVLSNKEFEKVTLPTSTGVSVGGATWANANLGGSSSTAQGNVYRWSDIGMIYTTRTSGKGVTFDDAHATNGYYKYDGECYYDAASDSYTKYNTTDNKLVLDPVDDIVQLTYPGSGWRMPTLAEFNALFDLPTTLSSSGATFTQDANTVFLTGKQYVSSAASAEERMQHGKQGRYWASTISVGNLAASNPDYVQIGKSTSTNPSSGAAYRYAGHSIRPVR